ncbi:hypothetical protein AArcS_1573 [Natranaeroarchaeum sulfidigenes]|uniref:Uncharacterized protein n=1 Tax=Natranaeroarchaeum sulfidigenes TaxID=2784880 RepID=A0A897MQC3_9EURY|nr:hypothetical protein AArcS_1573 [Natranaeroarchaeum sulfidigenes]
MEGFHPTFVDAKCLFCPENPLFWTQNSHRCFISSYLWLTCGYEVTTPTHHTRGIVAKYRVDCPRNCWMAARHFRDSMVRRDSSDGFRAPRTHVGIVDRRNDWDSRFDIDRVAGSDAGWAVDESLSWNHDRWCWRCVSCHSWWVFRAAGDYCVRRSDRCHYCLVLDHGGGGS